MDEPQRDWSTLPTDIIILILDRLTNTTSTSTDRCRLGSVCSSWRTSLVSPKPLLQFPLEINLTVDHNETQNPQADYITQSTYYLISDNKTTTTTTTPTDVNVWITRVCETPGPHNHWSLQDPMSPNTLSVSFPGIKGTTVSFLDRNITQLATSYSVLGDRLNVVRKVVLFSIPEQQGFCVLALSADGDLVLWKSMEKIWKIVPNTEDRIFKDAIVYENEFYVTDVNGQLMAINPDTFEARDVIASDLNHRWKPMISNLVESNGKLYLVKISQVSFYRRTGIRWRPENLAVWVLSRAGTGLFWNPTWSLDDRIFFVSRQVTFSVSRTELGWERGDYIFFSQKWFTSVHNHNVGDCDSSDHTHISERQMFGKVCGMFDMQERTLSNDDPLPSSFKIFWPVPQWLISS